MKYWIESLSDKPMYTEKLLVHLAEKNGHKIEYDENAVILVSVCDVTEVVYLEKIRSKYKKNKIIAGGHFSKIGAVVMSLFVDIVWVGHGFDMFKYQKFSDIADDPAAYWFGKTDKTFCNYNIDWSQCPVIQTDASRFYVFGGVGCVNKCHFCVTSWTEPFENRPGIALVQGRAKKQIGKRGSVKVISNAYDNDMGHDKVQDMLLKDFIKAKHFKCGAMVRCGIEFATEQTRAKYGKPLRHDEIIKGLDVAQNNGVDLHFFMIGGLDKKSDWYDFVGSIPDSDDMKPRVFLKWTNFEPQQKTPLWKKCSEINPENYLDSSDTDNFFRIGAHRNKRIRVMPVKYPAHAIWRCMMSNVRDITEYRIIEKLKNEKDLKIIYHEFMRMRPWENDITNIVTQYDRDARDSRRKNKTKQAG